MNYNKVLNVTQSNSKDHWRTIFTIFVIVFSFTACNKESLYPSLKVENQLKDYWRSITGVSLVGYEFDNLNIEPNGDSQTFVLDDVMSGGYENINVTVRYIRFSGVIGSASIKVNFNKGETTNITLTGCDAEGCPGIYLESYP